MHKSMLRATNHPGGLNAFTIGNHVHPTAYTSFLTVLSPEIVDKGKIRPEPKKLLLVNFLCLVDKPRISWIFLVINSYLQVREKEWGEEIYWKFCF
ncbi:MAG: hypothetical protein P1U36_06130 [Legionellaceae bacterium]|nr:hypothetical protein [Legionellaceae bacterium]